MTLISQTQITPQPLTRQRWVTFGVILALLVLRYMVTVFGLVFPNPPAWVIPSFEIGTYLLVAILLIRESESLPDYHINALAIWMVILFKPIETIYLSSWTQLASPMAFPQLPSLCVWAVALGLLVRFRSRLFQSGTLGWQDLKWTLLGGLIGLVTVVVTGYPQSFTVHFDPVSRFMVLSQLPSSIANIPYQWGYAAISEEPVFRGFLWGFLRKSGWREVWIWFFQAGLFALAHLYYLRTAPLNFWFVVPIGGLVLGWLAWRSRSIATSMVAHGVMNGLTRYFSILVSVFR
jgi:membrane protease YdiL (CAAX protease family)